MLKIRAFLEAVIGTAFWIISAFLPMSGVVLAQSQDDAVLSGKYAGPLNINRSTTLSGMVAGDVTVLSGAKLYASGLIKGRLIVNKGGWASVTGTVTGTIENDGGYVAISGVYSFVETFDAGDTRIAKTAARIPETSPGEAASGTANNPPDRLGEDASSANVADSEPIVTLPNGKKVRLKSDGTYEIAGDDNADQRYSDVSILDLKVDFKSLNGKLVRTRARGTYFAQSLILTDPNVALDMNGVDVTIDDLNRDDRKWIVAHCADGCSIVVEGRVDSDSFLPTIMAQAIKHK